jgi:arabinofuranosyltransferase
MTTVETESITADTSPETTRTSLAERIGLAAGAVLLLYFAFNVFAFVHDDAFITYRYSYNLRHGFGAVFNPGEHTEGYSCPLYMLLTALLMFLPGDVLFRAKVLGLLFAVGAVWAAWRLAKELDLPVWARASAPFLVGVNSSVAFSAIDGMETSLQMLFVTVAALVFLREQRAGEGWHSALWLLAAALNRAEGAVFFLAALVPFFMGVRQRGFGKRERTWLVAFVVPMALFLLWRLYYYHDLLPNTVYAKNMPLMNALDPSLGPAYLGRTLFVNLNQRISLALISGVLWLVALAGAVSERLKRPGGLVLPLLVLAQTLVALRAGGDWMQGWRYMMAVVPLWTLLIVLGAVDMAQGLEKVGQWQAGIGLGMTCVALFAGLCLWAAPDFRDPKEGAFSWARQGWATDAKGLLRDYRMANTIATAEFLNRTLPKGALVAYSEMGATPFYTPELRWLDTYGLTDRTIARIPTLGKFRTGVTGDFTDAGTTVGRHILGCKPDYVIRWLLNAPSGISILDGNYLPMARTSLHNFQGDEPLVLQVWKRADK